MASEQQARVIGPEEFAERMRDLLEGDPENDHIQADELMCETLRRLGYGKGVDLFAAAGKWYS